MILETKYDPGGWGYILHRDKALWVQIFAVRVAANWESQGRLAIEYTVRKPDGRDWQYFAGIGEDGIFASKEELCNSLCRD